MCQCFKIQFKARITSYSFDYFRQSRIALYCSEKYTDIIKRSNVKTMVIIIV